MIFEGEATSYRALNEEADRIARALVAAGIRKGDRVGLLGKNSARFLLCVWGILKAGGIVTPINWRLAGKEVVFVVEDADIRLIFHDQEFGHLLDTLRSRPGLRLIDMGNGASSAYAGFLASGSDAAPDVEIGHDDIALQIYTSGTTGKPKGAMLTNRNLSKFCDLDTPAYPSWWQVHPEDISLVALPLFHIGGLETALRVLFSGGQIVIQREFEPGLLLEAIEIYRPTLLALVPTALQIVLRHPRASSVNFSCIRVFFYGASPIPAALVREALEMMDCGFVQCYGMSETTSAIVALPPEDHSPAGTPRMQAAGKPLPNVEVRVVDESGKELPPHCVGEIVVRAPYVMKGYWNREEAAASPVEGDGWLRTGDAGYVDEDGYVYIRDRVKDMIVSGAENIYPAEVESAIFGHPIVKDVAVIGVPDDVWGESVKALVVLRPDCEPDEAGIIAWTRQRIASFKVPKTVDVVAELPRNAAGKVLKGELRKPFWQGRARAVN